MNNELPVSDKYYIDRVLVSYFEYTGILYWLERIFNVERVLFSCFLGVE